MKIVCFGDSLTSCGGENGRYSDVLQDRFPQHQFVNKGVGGESFVEAMVRFQADVLDERPDVLIVELGANDWWRNERLPEAWARDLDAILTAARAQGAHGIVLGVFGEYLDDAGRRQPKAYGTDERAVAYRAIEAAVAARHGCDYVANIQERIVGRRCCWSDSNHPNEFGNRFVADTIEPLLERKLQTRALPVRRPTLQTTRDFWDEAVALAPDRLAVVDGDRRLTYAQANRTVENLAAGLARTLGLSERGGGPPCPPIPRQSAGTDTRCHGPKVAVYLPNCLEYYLAYWATVRLGGVIVPLNTWLKEDSLGAIFEHVRPDVLLVGSKADTAPLRAAAAAPPRLVAALTPDAPGLTDWQTLLADAPTPPRPPIAPDAPSIIMHTSGTTAAPKGAVMRHSDLMFNVMTTLNAHQFNVRDVHLLVNPMFHCTALYSSLPSAAYTKTPVIIASPSDPQHLMELVQRERITTFLSVPSVFQQLLKVPRLEQYDASSLRVIAYAGSAMPVSTIRRLHERFPNVALHNFFGLTETISMTHVLRGEDAEARPDSIGRLLPFVEARIVDEAGRALPPGEVGELLFSRANAIPGYYNDPGRLEESVVTFDGHPWFRTGDLATVDAEGYFFIKGRKKDMIIVGGENVYAAEVEAMLMTHDQVVEAAVKGEPATGAAAFLGEQVKAYVVRGDETLTERALRDYCRQRLPPYKVPWRIVFLPALPRNPSGKVVKTELA